jgi:hypothetical protein
MRLLVVIAAALLVAAAPAGAASWQPPERVSQPTAFLGAPHIGFDVRGDALVTWGANAGKQTFADPTNGPGAASSRWALRPAKPPQWLPEKRTGRMLVAVCPYARLRAVGLILSPTRKSVSAAWFDLEKNRIVRTQLLGRADRIENPTLDVGWSGDAVAAWSALTGRRHHVVVAVARARHPKFGRQHVFSAAGAIDPVVDVNPRADAIVAWSRGGRIEMRARRARTHFGPVRRAGTASNSFVFSAAVGPGGRGAVAWTSQAVDNGDPVGPASLYFAYAGPRGGAFHPATRVEQFARGTSGSPQVVFDSTAGGKVAWVTGATGALRAAWFEATKLGPTQTLATSSGAAEDGLHLARLTSDFAHGTLLAFIRGDLAFRPEVPTRLFVVLSPGSQNGFGAPEAASPADDDVYDADADFDPRLGQVMAVWTRELGGTEGRVVEAAVRR